MTREQLTADLATLTERRMGTIEACQPTDQGAQGLTGRYGRLRSPRVILRPGLGVTVAHLGA